MLQPVEPRLFLRASPTLAMSIAWMDIRILWRKLVSSFAVGLLSVKTPTSIDVHLWGDRLKMGWIAAAAHPAKMVDLQTIWNRPLEQFIAESMDVDVPSGNPNDPILTNQSTFPDPATGIGFNVNLVQNSLGQHTEIIRPRHE